MEISAFFEKESNTVLVKEVTFRTSRTYRTYTSAAD